MSGALLKDHPYQSKWYLNGFPKSGLHWVALMLEPVATLMPASNGLLSLPWSGMFRGNSWTTERMPLERWAYIVGLLQPGHSLYAHCGYSEEVSEYLRLLGVAHIFIYRDPRDVVVSQAYHVLADDDDNFHHPDKELYREIKKRDGMEGVIRACIEGVDKYPGVMERWEQYAGWLGAEWVHKVRFEDMVRDSIAAASGILAYGLRHTAHIFGMKLAVDKKRFGQIARTMVAFGNMVHRSPTFRKGEVGDWREYFTPELIDLMKATDRNNWLERLKYNDDW